MKNVKWIAVFFAILSVLILVGIAWSGYGLLRVPEKHLGNPDILLPILVSVSSIGLLVVLAFLAVSFSVLDLADRSQALGLPEGSVRALISLLLIMMFVITSIFLYRQIQFNEEGVQIMDYIGISEDMLNDIPNEEIVAVTVKNNGDEQVFDVKRRIEAVNQEASQRFAEQVLTTISTLVVSVSAFYFGSRSVSVARGTVSSASSPTIRSINLTEGRQGDAAKDVEILGKNFDSPKTVKLVRDSDEIPIEEISASETRIRGKFAIPAGINAGKYDLAVVNKDGGEDRLVNAFEVKKKEPPVQEPVEVISPTQDPAAAQG